MDQKISIGFCQEGCKMPDTLKVPGTFPMLKTNLCNFGTSCRRWEELEKDLIVRAIITP